ncbi:MAG: hypothetical protein GC202_09755 [Alphaproteobacteria bacterium]|nr:hypothetical protein [Alphaproteobacteria bacterium]
MSTQLRTVVYAVLNMVIIMVSQFPYAHATEQRMECAGGHVCTLAEDHHLTVGRGRNGLLYDCSIRFVARALKQPYAFLIIASAGEGEVLPYMRLTVRAALITPQDKPNEVVRLKSARIVDPDATIDTQDWTSRIHDGAILLRVDIFPENRTELAKLAAIATRKSFAMEVQTDDEQRLLVGVAQLRPTGDIADRFLECMEQMRREVGG